MAKHRCHWDKISTHYLQYLENQVFYQSLLGKSNKETEFLIQDYISTCYTKHNKPKIRLMDKFELWIEYLKRSAKYQQACDWFEEARSSHPYPDEFDNCKHEQRDLEDYMVFASSYVDMASASPAADAALRCLMVSELRKNSPMAEMFANTFFGWAVKAGFPDDRENEILMNLFFFGNIHKDSQQITLLRIMQLIEMKITSSAGDLSDNIDAFYNLTEKVMRTLVSPEDMLKRYHVKQEHLEDPEFQSHIYTEASVENYKQNLKQFFECQFSLNISILNPFADKDLIISTVKNLIDERREELKKADRKQDFDQYNVDQFEWFSGKVHPDDLQLYLDVYDLKKEGKTNVEVAKIKHPHLETQPKSPVKGLKIKKPDAKAKKDVDTYIGREFNKAQKIIQNVENGFFPGNYQ